MTEDHRGEMKLNILRKISQTTDIKRINIAWELNLIL